MWIYSSGFKRNGDVHSGLFRSFIDNTWGNRECFSGASNKSFHKGTVIQRCPEMVKWICLFTVMLSLDEKHRRWEERPQNHARGLEACSASFEVGCHERVWGLTHATITKLVNYKENEFIYIFVQHQRLALHICCCSFFGCSSGLGSDEESSMWFIPQIDWIIIVPSVEVGKCVLHGKLFDVKEIPYTVYYVP